MRKCVPLVRAWDKRRRMPCITEIDTHDNTHLYESAELIGLGGGLGAIRTQKAMPFQSTRIEDSAMFCYEQ